MSILIVSAESLSSPLKLVQHEFVIMLPEWHDYPWFLIRYIDQTNEYLYRRDVAIVVMYSDFANQDGLVLTATGGIQRSFPAKNCILPA